METFSALTKFWMMLFNQLYTREFRELTVQEDGGPTSDRLLASSMCP